MKKQFFVFHWHIICMAWAASNLLKCHWKKNSLHCIDINGCCWLQAQAFRPLYISIHGDLQQIFQWLLYLSLICFHLSLNIYIFLIQCTLITDCHSLRHVGCHIDFLWLRIHRPNVFNFFFISYIIIKTYGVNFLFLDVIQKTVLPSKKEEHVNLSVS